MVDFRTFAINLIKNNPNVANNPNAVQMLQVIQNGDEQQGSQIAENICKSMNISKEEAMRRASAFFNIR